MRKDSETMRLFEGRYPRECICAKTAGNHSYNFHFNFFTTPIDEFYTLMTPCNMLDGKMVPQPRYGKLYHCKYCGESWYLTENKERAVRLEKKDYTPFMKWLEFDFQIPDDWVRVFNEIGGEHAHYPCEVLYMPCEAILKDGRQVLATICFQKDPWIEEFGHPINRYVTEISEVHESPYMLSREIQELAMNANELAMGFRPTIIEAPSGENLLYRRRIFLFERKMERKRHASECMHNGKNSDGRRL